MKACRLYFTKEDIAKKLGIKGNQLVIADVDSNSSEVEFTLFIDQNAEVKNEQVVADLNEDGAHWNFYRNKFE